MRKTKCPACKKSIQLEKGIGLDDLVKCPECKNMMEVVQLNPPLLDWAGDPITAPYSRSSRITK